MPRPVVLVTSLYLIVSAAQSQAPADWLLIPRGSEARSTLTPWSSNALAGLAIGNGLVERRFVTNASGVAVFGTWDLRSFLDIPDGESLLRGLSPEATLACVGCAAAARGPQPGPGQAFRLIANNSAVVSSDCVNVGQGDDSSLAACEASCWAQGVCNAVNYADKEEPLSSSGTRHGADGLVRRKPAPRVRGTDCVLRVCTNAMAPQLTPMTGFAVYATPAAAATNSTRIGGLVGGAGRGDLSSGPYFNRTGLDAAGALLPDPGAEAFSLASIEQGPTRARFNWTRGARGADPSIPWPPPGLRLSATFTGSGNWDGVTATVIYEIYDGIPLIAKWVELSGAAGTAAVILDAVVVEDLALNPPFSPVASSAYPENAEDVAGGLPLYPGAGKLFVATDYQYGTTVRRSNDVVSRGGGAAGSTQPRLTASDDNGLGLRLAGGAWTSMRVYELMLDDGPEQGPPASLYPSSETYWGCTLGPCAVPGSGTPFEGGINERRGLAMRRFLLAVAPQVAESPLQYHLVASDSASIRAACDQMASVAWEMLVLSYGSGANIESTDPTYQARIAGDVAYCKAKGIEVGMCVFARQSCNLCTAHIQRQLRCSLTSRLAHASLANARYSPAHSGMTSSAGRATQAVAGPRLTPRVTIQEMPACQAVGVTFSASNCSPSARRRASATWRRMDPTLAMPVATRVMATQPLTQCSSRAARWRSFIPRCATLASTSTPLTAGSRAASTRWASGAFLRLAYGHYKLLCMFYTIG